MKLIRPYYQILSNINADEILKSIERAGRTCYKSEDQISRDSAEKFIRMIVKLGHESVLEHEKISILFVCDRGVSHELVRHRIASFSQESTRYCNYSKDKFDNKLTFIIPCWSAIDPGEYPYDRFETENIAFSVWMNSMWEAERSYNLLIEKGWQPQQARSILPNSLKTEIVVTANIREWRTIFKQRTSAAAHPQMRELMIPLLLELYEKLPSLFEDLISEIKI